MYSKNLYLIITNYSKTILHLWQWNLVAQYSLVLDSKKKYPLYTESFGSLRENSAFRSQVHKMQFF